MGSWVQGRITYKASLEGLTFWQDSYWVLEDESAVSIHPQKPVMRFRVPLPLVSSEIGVWSSLGQWSMKETIMGNSPTYFPALCINMERDIPFIFPLDVVVSAHDGWNHFHRSFLKLLYLWASHANYSFSFLFKPGLISCFFSDKSRHKILKVILN